MKKFRASGGAAQAAGPGGTARHADFSACGGPAGPREARISLILTPNRAHLAPPAGLLGHGGLRPHPCCGAHICLKPLAQQPRQVLLWSAHTGKHAAQSRAQTRPPATVRSLCSTSLTFMIMIMCMCLSLIHI